MSKVAVVYWSSTGNTEAMANAVAEGAKAAGAEVISFESADFSADKVDEFDAIAFGCPAMGAEVLEESEMEPFVAEVESFAAGKTIALFGSYGWGDGEWMREWESRMLDAGANVLNREGLICHETPDDDKMKKLVTFLQNFGYTMHMQGGQEIRPKEVQKLLDKIEGTPEEAMISRLALRSMKQARYSTECTGHFGLSCKYYCHFTSPIRRYPDLQIHRIIKENLHGELSEKRIEHYRHILPTVANDNSAKERRAEEAERDVIKLKEIEYMSEHIGEEFDGVISGVTSNYIFVELDNTVEGAVSVAYMYDDFYYFNEQEYAMVGEKTKKKYQLGDKVRIKVLKCDKIKKTIDFSLIDGNIEGVEKSGEATRDETDSQ